MRKFLVFVLSLPILAFGLAFDLVKLPALVLLFLPVYLCFWLINLAKGNMTSGALWEEIADVATLGLQLWWRTLND